MAFVQLQNLHSPTLVLSAPLEPVQRMISAIGADQVSLLLHHHAAQQNRNLAYVWEQWQIPIGILLGLCLYSATQKRILPIVLCAIMLAIVVFQLLAITPELSFRGRETDFPPNNAIFGSMARMWALNQVYVGTEVLKIVIGGILASYMFVLRTSRRRSSRRESDSIDQPSPSASLGLD